MIGITKPVTYEEMALLTAQFTTNCNRRGADPGWIFTLFFLLLGFSSVIRDGWLETAEPRRAGFVVA